MDYSILRYGAVADGVTNCAAAIQQAVDAAAAAGGGRVIVPAGRFLSGSVLLKDNVELHLESGAGTAPTLTTPPTAGRAASFWGPATPRM